MEKENELRVEKERDKELIEEIMRREKVLKELEEKQKSEYQRQIREFFKSMKNRSKETLVNQKLVDELLRKEIER